MPNLDPLLRYFAAEKQGGLLCLSLGLVALAASFAIWRSGASYRSMAFSLAAIALVQLAVGAALWLRTDAQVAELTGAFGRDLGATAAAELERMVKINRSFVGIMIGELVLVFGSAGVAFLLRSRPLVAGIAAGLLVQAAVMLAFDLFAEHRAGVYTEWLESVKPPAVG